MEMPSCQLNTFLKQQKGEDKPIKLQDAISLIILEVTQTPELNKREFGCSLAHTLLDFT